MLADPGREGIEAYDKDHNDYLHILAMLDTSVHHSISIWKSLNTVEAFTGAITGSARGTKMHTDKSPLPMISSYF